jgi:hypothetical protein
MEPGWKRAKNSAITRCCGMRVISRDKSNDSVGGRARERVLHA